MQINNLIPKYQQENQTIGNLKEILMNLPNIPKMNETYKHIRLLTERYSNDIRIDIINGVHKPEGDGFHFNIRVYDRRTRPHTVVYDNLHVYVTPSMSVDSKGNPVTMWNISRFNQITQFYIGR